MHVRENEGEELRELGGHQRVVSVLSVTICPRGEKRERRWTETTVGRAGRERAEKAAPSEKTGEEVDCRAVEGGEDREDEWQEGYGREVMSGVRYNGWCGYRA